MCKKNIEGICKKRIEDFSIIGVHFAGDFNGIDTETFCDKCNENYPMSELTTIHREDDADLFICGNCLMNNLKNGL